MSTSYSPRLIQFGPVKVPFPSKDLAVLEDCNGLLHDVDALHKEMSEKGYLFIRGFHNRQEVLEARSAVLAFMEEYGDALSQAHPVEEGVLREGCGVGCVPFMEGHNTISHKDSILSVIEGHRPYNFFREYFGSEAVTFDYKWLRAMPRDGFTGAHVDSVYMSRGSEALLTMWTPFGDVDIEMGVLAVCEASHRLPEFSHFQATYGRMDAEKVGLRGTGWFTEDPFEITRKFGGQWKTTDFKAGDALIFNLRTVHMSTTNTTNFARISCDTRWQPACEEMDPRFCKDTQQASTAKFGLLSKLEDGLANTDKPAFVTIDKLKEEWRI
ncbi:hiv tat-specific factor 1 [Plakobranchus ocellatus]|uniref:Hiv tat-specific factor 1 n=1 Tax=Plakobranchus ocellatus TaxID=259542 RepID=A0AAV4CNN7_9GAST|nr:hiv tat-specific factor 1 [Plakobranchus ocellatus]